MAGQTHGAGGVAEDLMFGGTGLTTNITSIAGATLQFDLISNDGSAVSNSLLENDMLRLVGDGTASLQGTVNIATTLATGWTVGDTWKLIDWSEMTTSVTSALTLSGTPDITGIGNWETYVINDGSQAGNGFYLRIASAVPEPSRALLLLTSLCGIIAMRRRKATIPHA